MSEHPARPRRWLTACNLSLFLVGVITIIAVVNVFAQRPELRGRIDATKTRAYSLSPQTLQLLDEITGDWTIAVLVIEQDIDRAVRRQIDEVLDRYRQAAPNVNVTRIDPTDPRTLDEYEALLARLRAIYHEPTGQYEQALDDAQEAFEDLLLFAQQESGRLDEIVTMLDTAQPGAQELAAHAQHMGLLAEQGEDVLNEIVRARRITDARPIPDYDVAVSILVEALSMSANDLYDTAEMFADWMQQRELPMELRQYGANQRRAYEDRAQQLARVVDPLRHLPAMELASIGEQLAEGEAAVIIGPNRATVIPAAQLFPKSNFRSGAGGEVTFDQRFRGEQLISAAIRSLLVEHMPAVVFVHSGPESWLRRRERQIDLLGVAHMLHASRYEVKEWIVGESDRPDFEPDAPVVWVAIAPPSRRQLEPSEDEVRLLRAIDDLIATGESVLLNLYPSMLPRYGQRDPWAALAGRLGIQAKTDSAVFEFVRTGADRKEIQRHQALQRFPTDHPVSRAVHGQMTYLGLPVPLEPADEVPGNWRMTPLANVEPGERRWLETNWSADPETISRPGLGEHLREPVTIAWAIERPAPGGRGPQRAIVIGSGGWMLSFVADSVVSLGGERVALSHPGNHELMLASAAWLAGMDDLIAQSPTVQEVSRIGEISNAAGYAWFWMLLVGLPGLCLIAGAAVWTVRKR